MIDGLKLTMTGVELKSRLEERIACHAHHAAECARQLHAPDAADEELLPEAMLEHEIERAHGQIEALTLIRDYIVADEVYRLGEYDLYFADLLPEPGWAPNGTPLHRQSDLPALESGADDEDQEDDDAETDEAEEIEDISVDRTAEKPGPALRRRSAAHRKHSSRGRLPSEVSATNGRGEKKRRH
ncbi:MAG: hypothetical protein ACT4QD_03835 [Acidobacteriota bacterium]